jgi:SulP family sulfate permease
MRATCQRRWQSFFWVGVLQIAFGALRLGRYVSYTPYSVVSGFMSGIGVIIILI